MKPEELRAKVGLEKSLVAIRMGISPESLGILEATPLGAWKVSDAAKFAAARNHVLKVFAVSQDGDEDGLEIT